MTEKEYTDFLRDRVKKVVNKWIVDPFKRDIFCEIIEPFVQKYEDYDRSLEGHKKNSEKAAKKNERLRRKTKKPPKPGMIWCNQLENKSAFDCQKHSLKTERQPKKKYNTTLTVGGQVYGVVDNVAQEKPLTIGGQVYDENMEKVGFWMHPFQQPHLDLISLFPQPILSLIGHNSIPTREPSKHEKLAVHYTELAIIHDAQSKEVSDNRIYFNLTECSNWTWADQFAELIWDRISNLDSRTLYEKGDDLKSHFEGILRVIQKDLDIRANKPQGKGGKDIPVDDKELTILAELAEGSDKTYSQVEIEAATSIPRGTIKDKLLRLESIGLIHRPLGKRKGYQITDKGREVAHRNE